MFMHPFIRFMTELSILLTALLLVSCAQWRKENDPVLNEVMTSTVPDDPNISVRDMSSGMMLYKPDEVEGVK